MSSIGGLFTSTDVPQAKTYSGYQLDKNDYDNTAQDAQVGAQNSSLLNKFSNVNAPQAGQVQIDPNAGAQNAAGQQALIGQLQAQANGTGPSLASGMLKEGTDRTLANQAALAATTGASNPALAQRNLAVNAIGANQQLAQASAQQRMQDQINAQNQLGSVLSGARGQDIGLAENQAQLTQGANLANLQASTATNAQNLQGATDFNQQQLGYDNNVMQALQNYQGQNSTNTSQANSLNEQAQEDYYKRQAAAQAQKNAAIGGLISGAAQIGLGVATGGASTALSGIMGAVGGSGGGGGAVQNPNNPSQMISPYQNIQTASNGARGY
jgi:hypothetical protein